MWLQKPYGAWLDHPMYHIFCEANGCVDALAKRGNQLQYLLENYDTCPVFVYTAFVWDLELIRTIRCVM